MNYYLIIRPLIGAGIGYVTNWIAVKMLFRPLAPVKIGKFILPFTPGIIPKNKERIAISIGDAISNNLLTEEALRENLLSEDKKIEIKNSIEKVLNKYSDKNNLSLKEFLSSYINSENINVIENKLSNALTDSIYNSLIDSNVSSIIADQIQIAASEKLKGSILGIIGGNSIISSMIPEIEKQIKQYIEANVKEVISDLVNKEINKFEERPVSEIVTDLNKDFDFSETVMNVYENIVINKMPKLLENINISKIVSDKIISMPTLEVEKLILQIMKKELNALVNLGALIGFILGLLNLLF